MFDVPSSEIWIALNAFFKAEKEMHDKRTKNSDDATEKETNTDSRGGRPTGDPRTIWGSNDESLEENNVIDGVYEPSGLASDEGESFDANPQIPENYAKVTQ